MRSRILAGVFMLVVLGPGAVDITGGRGAYRRQRFFGGPHGAAL
jgi:hypothetical protein